MGLCCCSSCHSGMGLQVATDLIKKSEYVLMAIWALFGLLGLYGAMVGSVMNTLAVVSAAGFCWVLLLGSVCCC